MDPALLPGVANLGVFVTDDAPLPPFGLAADFLGVFAVLAFVLAFFGVVGVACSRSDIPNPLLFFPPGVVIAALISGSSFSLADIVESLDFLLRFFDGVAIACGVFCRFIGDIRLDLGVC